MLAVRLTSSVFDELDEFVLHYTPALHDPFAMSSMHFAGSSDDDFDNHITPEMAARTPPCFASRSKNIRAHSQFCKRLI